MIHVLPGDALVEDFKATKIDGDFVVCRECLVDGDVSGETDDAFWRRRAEFVSREFGESVGEYDRKVVGQFRSLRDSDAEVCLWFGNDLFCQVNYWFCLSLLERGTRRIFRVAPDMKGRVNQWNCFNDADLQSSFLNRTELGKDDLNRGADLWRAFRDNNLDVLCELGETTSPAFPFLKEIVAAAIKRENHIPEVLRELSKGSDLAFPELFIEFTKASPVYGFGDAQVKRWLARI